SSVVGRQGPEHLARGVQIRGPEALREACVYRCEHLPGIIWPILIHPQTGEACGCTQFPEQRAVLPGDGERASEAVLDRRELSADAQLEQTDGLYAQKLGKVPALASEVRRHQRPLNGRERFVRTVEPDQSFRQHALEAWITDCPSASLAAAQC